MAAEILLKRWSEIIASMVGASFCAVTSTVMGCRLRQICRAASLTLKPNCHNQHHWHLWPGELPADRCRCPALLITWFSVTSEPFSIWAAGGFQAGHLHAERIPVDVGEVEVAGDKVAPVTSRCGDLVLLPAVGRSFFGSTSTVMV